jgi:hypothetical protein
MDDDTAQIRTSRAAMFGRRAHVSNALLAKIVETERRIAAWHAEQARLLADYAEVNAGEDGQPFSEFAPDELALRVGWTPNTARRRLVHAVALTTRLPRVLDALDGGLLDQRRADILVEAVEHLPDQVAHTVTDDVLARGVDRNPSQLRRLVRRAILRHDPDGAARRHNSERAKRRVEFLPAADGMARLHAYLPATEATAIYQRIDAFARQAAPGDGRTLDQRRADVLVDLMLNPAFGQVTTTINLTVPATTVSGEGDQPGELGGYGPVTAGQARELAGWGSDLTPEPGRVRPPCGRARSRSGRPPRSTRKIVTDTKWRRMITDPGHRESARLRCEDLPTAGGTRQPRPSP